jgi:hypothetical protein
MTDSVQLPVQLPYSYVQLPCSPLPCLPLGELHACTRAARSPIGIGSSRPSSFHPRLEFLAPLPHGYAPSPLAGLTCAFSALDCTSTAVRSTAHQRPPPGLARFGSLSGYRIRSHALPKPLVAKAIPDCLGITSVSRQCQVVAEGVLARVSNHVFHSVEAVDRASQAQPKRLRGESSNPGDLVQENLERVPAGGNLARQMNPTASLPTRRRAGKLMLAMMLLVRGTAPARLTGGRTVRFGSCPVVGCSGCADSSAGFWRAA